MKQWINIGAEHFDDRYLLLTTQNDGWNVYLNSSDYCFYLYNHKSKVKSQLPHVKEKIHAFSKCVVLSSSSSDSYLNTTTITIVMLVYDQFMSELHCTCEVDEQWHKGSLFHADDHEYEDGSYIFCDVVAFNSKFYGICHENVITEIIIRQGSRETELSISNSEVPYRIPVVWFKTARFVLSCDNKELFVVLILTNIKIGVFRFDVLNSKFIPVYDLGERFFFIKGNYSTCVSGSKLRNCVCFAEELNELLYLLNLEDGTLSVNKVRFDNSFRQGLFNNSCREGLFFLSNVYAENYSSTSSMLDCSSSSSSTRTTNREDCKKEDSEESLIMLKLPLHLQELVAKYVNKGHDYLNSRTVCKTWRSMIPTRQWKSCVNTRRSEFECPWLMSNKRNSATCKLSDPKDNATYLMSHPELSSDCVIRCSKDGWLLVTKGLRTMFLYEPFAKKKIKLPKLIRVYRYNGICLSDHPSSPKLSIFGFYHEFPVRMTIIYLNPGDQGWTERDYVHEAPFTPSYCNPIFSNGAFYYLSQEGSLGVFKLEELTWEIVSISTPSPVSDQPSTTNVVQSFLISYYQDLYSVYVSNVAGEFVKVYKLTDILLSDGKGEWEQVTSLGKMTLFVSETSCYAVVATIESMENKIYLPCFSLINNKHVFYCLESGKYSTFGGGDRGDIFKKGLCDTKEQLHCTWIQPRLAPSSW